MNQFDEAAAARLIDARSPGSWFEIRIAQAGQRILARVTGEMDGAAARSLESRLSPLIAEGRRVVLDLRQAAYLDSDGVRALLRLRRDLQARHGELCLVLRAGSRALRTLVLLRLDGGFSIYDSALLAWVGKPRAAHPAPPDQELPCAI